MPAAFLNKCRINTVFIQYSCYTAHMGRRKREDYNVRSLVKNGSGGIGVTLPIEEIRSLKWRSKQKVVITRSGNKLIIEDWEK